jgi:hypothetical protein
MAKAPQTYWTIYSRGQLYVNPKWSVNAGLPLLYRTKKALRDDCTLMAGDEIRKVKIVEVQGDQSHD